jgi:hypothetical protein
MLSTVKPTLGFKCDTVETPGAGVAPAASGNKQITQSGFDASIVLSATSTPPAQGAAYLELSGASGTIDLTALQTVFGVQSFTGQKLRGVQINNPNPSGDFAIAAGASNGYSLLGAPLVAGPGVSASMPGMCQQFFSDALGAISGTAKTLDWTNATGGTVAIALILG